MRPARGCRACARAGESRSAQASRRRLPPAAEAPQTALPRPLHRARATLRLLQQPPRRRRDAATGDKIRSSPLVRRMARENNIDLSQVPGTGAGGRVSKQDMLAAIEGGSDSAPAAASSCACPAAAPARPSAPPPAGGASASARSRNRRAARDACISAITKCSPCPSCARESPSTWCFRSAFRRTSTRSRKWTSRGIADAARAR